MAINWRRGFFRAWVLLSCVWLILGSIYVYNGYHDYTTRLFGWKAAGRNLLSEKRETVDPYFKGYGDIVYTITPGRVTGNIEFTSLYVDSDLFDALVAQGKMTKSEEAPFGFVILPAQLSDNDKELLRITFRHWRMGNLAKHLKEIAMGLSLPPLALFVFGWIVAWMLRGFRGGGAKRKLKGDRQRFH